MLIGFSRSSDRVAPESKREPATHLETQLLAKVADKELRQRQTKAAPQARTLAPEQNRNDAIKHSLSESAREKIERKLAKVKKKLAQALRPYDKPYEAAEFYHLKRVPVGQNELPVERYFTAIEQLKGLPQYSTAQETFLPSQSAMGETAAESLTSGTWAQLGPGNIGGRTRALLVHPTNLNVMYAAGVTGGIWKSSNGGASWTPLNDMLPNLAVVAMAMDPKNPEIIYAGTGEIVGSPFTRGAGIFKTTDGGASWTHLSSTANNSHFYFVNDLVISPTNSQRIYAATWAGVYRSTDGGASWTRVLNPTNSEGKTVYAGCTDLTIRTDQSTDYLFAACGNYEQAAVYRNTDAAGAGSWTVVLSESGMGRTSLAIAPSNQSVIYAAAASIGTSSRGQLHAVFRSTSGGAAGTWTAQVRKTDPIKLNTLLFTNPISATMSECGFGSNNPYGQGDYDNVIAVDPADPNRVWVGGIDLFRSDDGGRNWGLASYWWASQTNPRFAHADQHVIVFHPHYNGTTNKTMFVGNDGGLFRTDDARAAVATGPGATCAPNGTMIWQSLNNNYGVTHFYHGVPYPDGKTYFGGTQDNGTVRGTDADGINGWREIMGGDGGYVAVDQTNPSTLYAEVYYLSLRKSTDGGKTFQKATNGITEPNENFLFITPFVMDPSNSQRLWIGGKSLWRTTDEAGSWTQASSQVAEGSVSAIAVAPSDGNYVLVGTSKGYIHRTNIGLSSNASTAWPYARPRSGYVSWVAFDPTNPSICYATYSTFNSSSTDRHLYKSTDGGASWTAIDNELPDIPFHCIIVDPANTSRLYVGTDLGVFVSTNGGVSWAKETTGFANVVTEAMSLNIVSGEATLFAFTHGRGAWRVSLGASGGGCPSEISPTSQSFEASGGTGSVNVIVASGCNWTARSNANWITITAGSSGSGNGTVSYSVSANTGAARTGTLTIAGQNFTVTQNGASCSYSISPTSQSFEANGGTGSVSVTTTGGCNWTASSNAAWVTITAGGNGSGNGTVSYSVAANTSSNSRTSMLTIAGQAFTVTQAGATTSARVVRVGTASGAPGSIAGVPIELISQGDENALGFSLTFDPAVLSNPEVSLGSDASGAALNANLSQAAQGRIGIALALQSGQRFATGTRQVAVVSFTITNGATAPSTPIGFADQPIAREVVGANANILPASYTPGTVTITQGFEADVEPRPDGSNNGTVTIADWVQIGRFAAGLDTATNGSEFQRADCAPRETKGDGRISTADWVQAGRYAAGLDPVVTAGGPASPATSAPALAFNIAALNATTSRTLRLIANNLERGQQGSVTVELEAQGNENALGFSLTFDPAQLSFVSAKTGKDAASAALNVNASQVAGGRVGIALALPAGQKLAAGARQIVVLTFAVSSTGNVTSTAIGFGDQPVAREVVDVNASTLPAEFAESTVTLTRTAATVSAASFFGPSLASESIVAAFGTSLATTVEVATSLPLPVSLAGTTVKVKDSAGVERLAPLFFVSPAQVNYQIPQGTATGTATITITSGDGTVSTGTAQIAAVAPGLFTANADGQGVLAAVVLRVRADGSQSYEAVARYDETQRKMVAVPVDLGPTTDQVFLILFGTGLRFRSSLSAVTLKMGGADAEVLYTGSQGGFAGLDQLNVRLPRSLAGRGEVELNLTVDGKTANPVKLSIR